MRARVATREASIIMESSGRQDDLAEEVARLHLPVRRGRVLEREGGVDDRRELPLEEAAHDVGELARRSHRAADDLELPVEDMAEVLDGVVARGRAAGDAP